MPQRRRKNASGAKQASVAKAKQPTNGKSSKARQKDRVLEQRENAMQGVLDMLEDGEVALAGLSLYRNELTIVDWRKTTKKEMLERLKPHLKILLEEVLEIDTHQNAKEATGLVNFVLLYIFTMDLTGQFETEKLLRESLSPNRGCQAKLFDAIVEATESKKKVHHITGNQRHRKGRQNNIKLYEINVVWLQWLSYNARLTPPQFVKVVQLLLPQFALQLKLLGETESAEVKVNEIEAWLTHIMTSCRHAVKNTLGAVAKCVKEATFQTKSSVFLRSFVENIQKQHPQQPGYARVAAGLCGGYDEFPDLVQNDLMRLPGGMDSIVFVDNSESLALAEESLVSVDVVGLDQETRPFFKKGRQKPNPVSTLQMSTRTRSFIFDLLIKDQSLRLQMFSLIDNVLRNESIVKLGQSFRDDLKEMKRSFGNELPETYFTCVDPLVEISTILSKVNPGQELLALNKLSFFCFGRPLSKKQQMSNWGQRPLTPEQLHYAALDAYILIPIAENLCGQLSVKPSEWKQKFGSCYQYNSVNGKGGKQHQKKEGNANNDNNSEKGHEGVSGKQNPKEKTETSRDVNSDDNRKGASCESNPEKKASPDHMENNENKPSKEACEQKPEKETNQKSCEQNPENIFSSNHIKNHGNNSSSGAREQNSNQNHQLKTNGGKQNQEKGANAEKVNGAGKVHEDLPREQNPRKKTGSGRDMKPHENLKGVSCEQNPETKVNNGRSPSHGTRELNPENKANKNTDPVLGASREQNISNKANLNQDEGPAVFPEGAPQVDSEKAVIAVKSEQGQLVGFEEEGLTSKGASGSPSPVLVTEEEEQIAANDGDGEGRMKIVSTAKYRVFHGVSVAVSSTLVTTAAMAATKKARKSPFAAATVQDFATAVAAKPYDSGLVAFTTWAAENDIKSQRVIVDLPPPSTEGGNVDDDTNPSTSRDNEENLSSKTFSISVEEKMKTIYRDKAIVGQPPKRLELSSTELSVLEGSSAVKHASSQKDQSTIESRTFQKVGGKVPSEPETKVEKKHPSGDPTQETQIQSIQTDAKVSAEAKTCPEKAEDATVVSLASYPIEKAGEVLTDTKAFEDKTSATKSTRTSEPDPSAVDKQLETLGKEGLAVSTDPNFFDHESNEEKKHPAGDPVPATQIQSIQSESKVSFEAKTCLEITKDAPVSLVLSSIEQAQVVQTESKVVEDKASAMKSSSTSELEPSALEKQPETVSKEGLAISTDSKTLIQPKQFTELRLPPNEASRGSDGETRFPPQAKTPTVKDSEGNVRSTTPRSEPVPEDSAGMSRLTTLQAETTDVSRAATLTEPAPEESGQKQNDCACAIL